MANNFDFDFDDSIRQLPWNVRKSYLPAAESQSRQERACGFNAGRQGKGCPEETKKNEPWYEGYTAGRKVFSADSIATRNK